ncbi:ATP-dependent DNA ligase [Ornithinimicrobium sp. INDO-MA30-4]|uniref:ATP-dependent DNA ligase n=1 Tax=Ornithinimicrobium sp. INDO-MA30-4 TaxID=2908651 RepID=UPI0037C8981E
MSLPIEQPIKPMLAKPAKKIPAGAMYEPKWDGFRSIIFRDGDDVVIGSRNEKPLTRYFPEVVAAVKDLLPGRCVVDGEIILANVDANRLDFEALQQRIHPADSRVQMLAEKTPASFVAFDLLALDDRDLMGEPFEVRRALLEEHIGSVGAPIYVTPLTRDEDLAADWFTTFEGAGLDGLMAKAPDLTYQPNKRVMTKIKHERTADCVVAGFRPHKADAEAVGSLLLGLYEPGGQLASVGVASSFTMARRKELFEEMQAHVTEWDEHPWNWAADSEGERTPQRTPAPAGTLAKTCRLSR